MEKNIQKAVEFLSEDESQLPQVDFQEMRKLRNLSNPKGKKLTLYE